MRTVIANFGTILRLIGLRHLRHRWRRTLLTTAGIAAAVALVTAVAVTHSTLKEAIGNSELGAGDARSLTVRPAGSLPLSPRTASVASRVAGVASVTPVVQQIARAEHRGRRTRTMFVAVPAGGARSARGGSTSTLPATAGLLLSTTLARQLSARLGSSVAVETPKGLVELPVTALLRSGQGTAINGGAYALLPLALAQRLFERPGQLDAMFVQVRRDVSRDRVRAALARSLGPTVRVGSSEQISAPFRRTYETLALTTRLISLLALVVAVLLVLNTQGMSLTERHREICLLRLSGTRPLPILMAFVAEATLLGVVAGALGVAAGTLLARAQLADAFSAYASVLPFTVAGPVRLSPLQAIGGIACGALIAGAGALLTVRRILTVRPIDLLRPKAAYAISAPAQDRRPVSVAGAAGLATVVGALLLVAARPGDASFALDVAALLLVGIGGALLLPSFVRVTSALLARGPLDWLGPVGWLATGAIARAPRRTVFTIGALVLSATMALAAGSAMGSFEQATRVNAAAWYPMPIYARGPGVGMLGSDQPIDPDVGRRLSSVPGVDAAYAVRFAAIESAHDRIVALAFPFAEAARRGDTITRDVPAGDRGLIAALASGSIVVSRPLAARLHLAVGGTLSLITAHGPRRFAIAGLFDSINPAGEVYIDRSIYRRVMEDDRADVFAISVDDRADVAGTTARLKRSIAEQRLPVAVMTRDEALEQVLGTVRGVFSLANVIRIAALIIAGLSVASTMLTSMSERRGEFGLLRLVGMDRPRLARSALTEAACTAGMASALAAALGFSLGYVILAAAESRLGMRLSFRPDVATFATAAAYTVAPALVASVYASWRSSRPPITELLAPRS